MAIFIRENHSSMFDDGRAGWPREVDGVNPHRLATLGRSAGSRAGRGNWCNLTSLVLPDRTGTAMRTGTRGPVHPNGTRSEVG